MNPFINGLGLYVLAPMIVFIAERIFGWRMPDRFPNIPKYMIIAEYHTSNWDFLALAYTAAKERRRLRFVIKKEARNWFLLGRILTWMGAVYIDRGAPLSAIKAIMKLFRETETCIMVICPSGTRAYTEGWLPGFYYLANKLKLPMVPGAPDFAKKTILLGEPLIPSGDIEADIANMAAFFAPITPRHPERATPVRLLPEAELQETAAVMV